MTAHFSLVDMLAETVQIFRPSLEEFERRLDKIHRQYESLTHGVTERRLRVLTVISTIFLPLSLVAGIYGMNFPEIPELHLRYGGYEFVLGCMILFAVGALLYFYRKGWFR